MLFGVPGSTLGCVHLLVCDYTLLLVCHGTCLRSCVIDLHTLNITCSALITVIAHSSDLMITVMTDGRYTIPFPVVIHACHTADYLYTYPTYPP